MKRVINIMKKIIAVAAALIMAAPFVFAEDNFYAYNKFIYNTILPEVGVCDVNSSFARHEVEYTDVNDYFRGLISIFNTDLDDDGTDELVTVESRNINVYTARGKDVVFCDNVKADLIGNNGDSFSNVFVKDSGGVKYLGVETFFANNSQNAYHLRVFKMENGALSNKAEIYQLNGENELYQSVAKNGISTYTHIIGNGLDTISDPENFNSVYIAAEDSLYNVGITDRFLDRDDRMEYKSSQYGKAHRLSDYVHEMEVKSYITGTGVRTTSKPVVIFENNSRLDEYIKECYDIHVMVNGEEIIFEDQDPIIKNDRTLIPVRAIFEALGAEVSWLPSSMKVVANNAETNITMTIGQNEYYVNGEKLYLDVPPMILNDRTLVPARAAAEGFGCNVGWDDSTKTVIINR